jgi:hypothetical protein
VRIVVVTLACRRSFVNAARAGYEPHKRMYYMHALSVHAQQY